MTIYLTVNDLTLIFSNSRWTIYRWVNEGKRIVFDGYEYVHELDPAGNWRFKRVKDESQ